MLDVFRGDAWLGIALLCLSLTIVNSLAFASENSSRDRISDLVDGVAVVMKAMVADNYPREAARPSGKILLLSVMSFGFVTFTCFSGVFLSELAIKKQVKGESANFYVKGHGS